METTLEKEEVSLMAVPGINDDYIREFYESKLECNLKKIRQIVCRHFNVPSELLDTDTRKREVVQARQICMKIYKEQLSISWAAAALPFGKDHATAMHASKTIDNLLDTDKQLKRDYDMIHDKVIDGLKGKALSIDGKLTPYVSMSLEDTTAIGDNTLQLWNIYFEDGTTLLAHKFEHSSLFISLKK